MNNFLRNPGSLNQLFDKGGPNPEFFNGVGASGHNLPFDTNLLYNFPNIGTGGKSNSTTAPSESLNPNLYLQNMNNNFLLPPGFGLGDASFYDNFLKNQNNNQHELNEKSLFNTNTLAENPGLIGKLHLRNCL